jgi:7 transmembrane sweet-taste receptor of 3 GCPR
VCAPSTALPGANTPTVLSVVISIVYSVWQQFAVDPAATSGVFSMFASKSLKVAHYNISNVLTTAFAHIAVVPLYHLSAYSLGTHIPLQLTAEIMGGILSGTINVWNDTQIQAANPLTSSYLPYKRINVAVRSTGCDSNSLVLKYLASSSPTFRERFNSAGGVNSSNYFDFSKLLPPDRMLIALSNDRVDSLVSTYDGSFGYYLQNSSPRSPIAHFCSDSTCSTGPVNPTVVASILACETPDTVINPSKYLYTYDLLSSKATGCYPIVGTVDYSLLATTDSTCSKINATHGAVLRNRIKFSSWLFNSSIVVQPLALNGVGASSAALRATAFKHICDITCGGSEYGYQYCGYRDCSWYAGDYLQRESECDPQSEKRTISYELRKGSTCKINAAIAPPTFLLVDCSDVLPHYKYGKIATSLSAIGMITCALVLMLVVLSRHEKIIKKSQPVFIYIFIVGAFMMNLCIIAMIGPNTDSSCLLRPWCINISSTIMFAPLLMKLHRIDMLFRLSKKLKKVKIPDHRVCSMRSS